jgi:CPA2 family monovalent cation:H+ antiporter-2
LGYIVAGFLASPHFEYLPSVADEGNIEFWAQLGIVVLLFSLGLEFSFKKLMNVGGSAVVTALIIVVGMMFSGYAIGHLLGFSNINSIFLGGMLSMSSTTIIIKALTDLNLRQKKFASMVFAVLIVEDLFAVLMMVILSSIALNNSVEGSEMLYSICKLLFFLIIWFCVGVYVIPTLLNMCRRYLNSETLLIVSMGLCLGMAIFSVNCGFSLALGAFVMGSILAGTSYAERIEHVVTPIKDLFGSVFFISVGMMVQPTIIAEYWSPILILSVVVVVGMIIFGTFGMLVTGQTLKVAMESGFSLTQIGEFSFIIASLGMSLGVLEPTIYPIVVAVSVITTFFTPYFIKLSGPAYNFVERILPQRLRFLIDRYGNEANTESAAGSPWSKVLKLYLWRTILYSIILIAITIVSHKYLMPWLDNIIPAWSHLATTGITIAVMSPFLLALMQPGAKKRQRDDNKISVPHVVMSIFCIIIALLFVVHVLTWAYSLTAGVLVGMAIIILIILVFSRRVRQQMNQIEKKFMANLNERELRKSGKKNVVVSDLHLAYMSVGYGCPFVGERLKNAGLRAQYGVNIVSIQRGGDVIPVPDGDRRIFPGDTIGVIGTDEQLAKFLHVVEQEPVNKNTISPIDIKLHHILLSDKSPLLGKTTSSASIRNSYEALVIAIQRNDEYLQPRDIVFAAGDILWIVGDKKQINTLK